MRPSYSGEYTILRSSERWFDSIRAHQLLRVGWPPLQSHKLGASQVQILDPLPFNGVVSVVVARLSVKQLERVRFPTSPQKKIQSDSDS
jgi:hypothetical protein